MGLTPEVDQQLVLGLAGVARDAALTCLRPKRRDGPRLVGLGGARRGCSRSRSRSRSRRRLGALLPGGRGLLGLGQAPTYGAQLGLQTGGVGLVTLGASLPLFRRLLGGGELGAQLLHRALELLVRRLRGALLLRLLLLLVLLGGHGGDHGAP